MQNSGVLVENEGPAINTSQEVEPRDARRAREVVPDWTVDSSSPSKRTKFNSKHGVSISSCDPDQIVLTNFDSSTCHLSGWSLCIVGQEDPVYTFADVSVAVGASIFVRFGTATDSTSPTDKNTIYTKPLTDHMLMNKNVTLRNKENVVVDEVYSRESRLRVLSLDAFNGAVVISNTCGSVIDISNFKLKAAKNSETFIFPLGTKLSPHGGCTVWTGPKATAAVNHPPTSFSWTEKHVFSPSGDFVTLLDPHDHGVSCAGAPVNSMPLKIDVSTEKTAQE